MKNKQYSAEEKTKIVVEAIKGEFTIVQITSKYGVHARQISKWEKQVLELLVQGFKSKAQSSDPDQKIRCGIVLPLINLQVRRAGRDNLEACILAPKRNACLPKKVFMAGLIQRRWILRSQKEYTELEFLKSLWGLGTEEE
jgi:transposase